MSCERRSTTTTTTKQCLKWSGFWCALASCRQTFLRGKRQETDMNTRLTTTSTCLDSGADSRPAIFSRFLVNNFARILATWRPKKIQCDSYKGLLSKRNVTKSPDFEDSFLKLPYLDNRLQLPAGLQIITGFSFFSPYFSI
jgi:hypothetical protein